MRLLLLNQYYPPDVAPTGVVLHDLARTLVGRGHRVRVICSRRSYATATAKYPTRESIDGVEVYRLPGLAPGHGLLRRVAGYAAYLGLLASRLMAARFGGDVVVSLTTPPYLGLLTRLGTAGRQLIRVQWIMDVYPDTMVANGTNDREGFGTRALQALARAQFSGAALVLALGPRMTDRLKVYMRGGAKLAWVPLWTGLIEQDERQQAARRVENSWAADDLVLLYAGNLGLGHTFADFLEAAERLGASGPLWSFAGGGPRRAEVERFAASHPAARIQLLPYATIDDAVGRLRAADVHLVSIAEGWEGTIVPSKLAAAFSVGRPVIFVGPRASEPADWILESGGGWVVPQGDVSGLLDAVEAARDPAERARRGGRALAFAREHFDRERNTTRIAELLEECARTRKAPTC